MNEIRVIIFDLWRTLAYKDFKNDTIDVIKKQFGLKESKEVLRKKFEMGLQTREWEKMYPAYEFLCKTMGIVVNDRNVRTLLAIRDSRERKVKLYSYVVPLLKKLKQEKYKTVLLSNTCVFSVKYLKKNTCLLDYFDSTMFSFEYGNIKPSAKGFEKIMKKYRVKPEEVLMIGDSLIDDIQPARKMGINTIHFRNSKQLKRDLKKFGIIL